MGNFAENLNLGNRFRPPLGRRGKKKQKKKNMQQRLLLLILRIKGTSYRISITMHRRIQGCTN